MVVVTSWDVKWADLQQPSQFFFFFSKAWIHCEDSPVVTFRTNAQNHKHSHRAPGSRKLYRHTACRAFRFYGRSQDFSELNSVWSLCPSVRTTKKAHFWPFALFLVPGGKNRFCSEEFMRECSLAHSLPMFILITQIYFRYVFHDNFSLNVGNLQHAVLVAVWFNQKILAEGLAYMAELLMLIPTFLQKMSIALR